jgi:hypothetical protein
VGRDAEWRRWMDQGARWRRDRRCTVGTTDIRMALHARGIGSREGSQLVFNSTHKRCYISISSGTFYCVLMHIVRCSFPYYVYLLTSLDFLEVVRKGLFHYHNSSTRRVVLPLIRTKFPSSPSSISSWREEIDIPATRTSNLSISRPAH